LGLILESDLNERLQDAIELNPIAKATERIDLELSSNINFFASFTRIELIN